MKSRKTIITLVICIAIASGWASFLGVSSSDGPGPYTYKSIRGEDVIVYGKGVYQHMSAEVAIQGIAQDYITLCLGIPLLLLSLFFTIKGSLKSRIVLAGTIGYFLVTYLFYLVMAMYNQLFLVYTFLLGTSFFALGLILLSSDFTSLKKHFSGEAPVKLAGGFLVFNALLIGFLWLSVVLPPILDGSIYPKAVEHYTTLIVQGIDLGLLLPLSVISGILLFKKESLGYLLAPVYFVFLSLLMIALIAKILFMGFHGYNIIPAIIIIPVIAFTSLVLSFSLLRGITAIKPSNNIQKLSSP